MGVVYKARDQRLERAVALKFLPRMLASNDYARRRLIEEAKAASALDHPNICTIFDIEETSESELFIAMAYYPGETLSELIDQGPLPLEQALDFAIQIGQGLAAAHEALIIHRDIKPSNVIITSRGTAKILDFGLAKARGERDESASEVTGTPRYMSPEQLRGFAVDQRTDIWSLAIVLYEMLTGHPPFNADTAQAMMRAIVEVIPRPVTDVRPDLPRELNGILARALEKSPAQRYARVEQFIDALQALGLQADSGRVPVVRTHPRTVSSVAVLPFVDLSPARDEGYFCDGIAEEILGALSAIRGLYVASRTSAFQFRGTSVDIREIGERLQVRTIVEGSVRKAGNRVRVTAQLINVDDGYRLWSDRYDREMNDVFAIQDDIASSVAEALQLTMQQSSQPTLRLATRDVDAYDAYLRGRHFFYMQRRQSYEVARQMFARAIEIDPAYALAYAGIANCCVYLHRFHGQGEDMVAEAEAASRRALELDPELAEARAARGLAFSLTKDFEAAEGELRRAIALDDALFDAHYFLGSVFFEQGKMGEAVANFARACSIAPENYFCWFFLSMAYHAIGDDGKGDAANREGLQHARTRLMTHPDDTRALTMAARGFAEIGEPERALAWIQRALAIDPDEPTIIYNAACTYVALGDREEALSALERAIGSQHHVSPHWIANDPDLRALIGDPRFEAMLE